MSREESKSDDETKFDDHDTMTSQKIHDPIVLALIDWGTSESFEASLSQWMKERCNDFVEALPGSDEEQPLSWGNNFHDYTRWLEIQLQDFCDSNGVACGDVAERMEETLASNNDFFPAVMAITDYDVFVKQMHAMAIAEQRADEATKAADDCDDNDDDNDDDDDVMNISGVWCADPEAYDPSMTERMLVHGKCPWMFRKILKRSSRLDVTLKQEKHQFTFCFTLHLFGTRLVTHPYEVLRDDKNLWGLPFKKKVFRPDKSGLRYQQFEHPGLPSDTIDTSHFYLEDDGDTLIWESRMYRSDLDKECVNIQKFIRKREGSSSNSSRDGRGSVDRSRK
jgi:hypothetical protein